MVGLYSLWQILQQEPQSFTSGRDSVTLSGTINYIKPGKGGKLIGIAQKISAGRTTGVYEVFIFNDEDVLLSRATFTMFFRWKSLVTIHRQVEIK